MAYTVTIFASILAISNAALLHFNQPLVYAPRHSSEDSYSPAIYDFAYSVHDTKTGDIKSQHESRRGDVVQGQYALVDADGLVRVVDYHADDQTGFNAHVRRQPGNIQTLTAQPAVLPSALPTVLPSALPSVLPSELPSGLPSALPSVLPTAQQPAAASQNQNPALFSINQQQQQIVKPTIIAAQRPISFQSNPLTLAQQSSSFRLPLALTSQSTSLGVAHHQALPLTLNHHQGFPLALSHHQAALPLSLSQQLTPLATYQTSGDLAHQGVLAQQAASLAYNQAAHHALASASFSPYAIAHTAPIAYHATAPLSHILAPAHLAIHR